MLEIALSEDEKEIDAKFVLIVWNMILKVGGVHDLSKVPEVTDPEHRDVKLILTMYTMDSFIFKRLNQGCRL